MVNSCPKMQSIKHIVLQTPHPILHTPYSTVLHTTYHSAFLLNAGSSTGLTWSVHGRPGELDGSFLILFPHPLSSSSPSFLPLFLFISPPTPCTSPSSPSCRFVSQEVSSYSLFSFAFSVFCSLFYHVETRHCG